MKIWHLLAGYLAANLMIMLATGALLLAMHLEIGTGRVLGASDGGGYANFAALPNFPEGSRAQIIGADARARLVDRYFESYGSSMKGLGKYVVLAADKYRIPFSLLPAIAMCEGNLGKQIPPGSFNTWGYGIYEGSNRSFSSWKEGIEVVSQALRRDYFDQGLSTPRQIMSKYTPSSNGSWADCVESFLEEMH